MCRAHRIIVRATVALWAVVVALVVLAPSDPRMRVVEILAGCLAVVMVPYCLYPWLVRDLLDERLRDHAGTFLAGWEAAKAPAPKEPRHLSAVR